jgi:crotonobetainyl-CoA:carnitine CoA-transferase CaiB-like acyl-CoA transferase
MNEGADTLQIGQLATSYAEDLLTGLGRASTVSVNADHPALAWRRAGLMAVTGRMDGPGLVAPVALTAAADGALAALAIIAPGAALPRSGALLLGERARLLGLSRQGAVSPNGRCRLLPARDGWIALNLPRAADWELLPALFGAEVSDWTGVLRLVATRPCADLVGQGRLLGLAIAADEVTRRPAFPFEIAQLGAPCRSARMPVVLDLSALWAGPLAGSLLQAAGARVLKVESTGRPDGARAGNRPFFDLLNTGKASIALDFNDPADVQQLQALAASADIVIESARPRALAALGIDAAAVARRGGTWISITAHGRTGEAGNWIGYGDDAAVAGGLAAAMLQGWGEALFAGDAIADPLTGITAALAGWASWQFGGGQLISLALSQVAAHACSLHQAGPAETRLWQRLAAADGEAFYPLRSAPGKAAALGADNAWLAKKFGATEVRRVCAGP